MSGVAVKASRNSNCDAALAATIRACPRVAMARRIAAAACAAAILPSEIRSSKTFRTMRKPPTDSLRLAHVKSGGDTIPKSRLQALTSYQLHDVLFPSGVIGFHLVKNRRA